MLIVKRDEVLSILAQIDVFVRKTMIDRIQAATSFEPMRDLPELLEWIEDLQSAKLFCTERQSQEIDNVISELESSINSAMDSLRTVIRARELDLGDAEELAALNDARDKLKNIGDRNTSASRKLIQAISSHSKKPNYIDQLGEGEVYDVALSFAGEDRAIAEKIANLLAAKNISVFYDNFEKADLWGKNLYTHLSDIYENRAKYCLIFISEFYAKKLWTKREREAAQARAFRQNREYILPLVLDDTRLPGIEETVGYVDMRVTDPSEVVSNLETKLNRL